MDRIRQKNTLLFLAGLAIVFMTIFILMAGIGPTAGAEVTLTPVSYFPVVRKDPTPTPRPIITPVPGAPNLLPNPSFEDGWTHPGNIPEIQVPVEWILSWDEGDNPLPTGHPFRRPESRHLSALYLPEDEIDLFIWDGTWTLKIFKGYGAVSFRLTTNAILPPGNYLLNVNIFPDLYVESIGSKKIWAGDPLSGEVQFVVDGHASKWILPTFGEKNTLQTEIFVSYEHKVDITVAMRGRWAIKNNGWFMDDWSLTKMN